MQELDESLELQDPYSDLSLFLSKKVKEQMSVTPGPKKWSLPLQDRLLGKISAEFQKKFPRYHLGTAPLKRVWEKVSHVSELFEKQPEALTSDGRVNLQFLVRENLKTVLAQRNKATFHPFLLAQQLALKVGESLATFEGIRPAIQHLTALIWSAEQHLLPFSKSAAVLEARDRLIIKWILDGFMETPDFSQHQLHEMLQKTIQQFLSLKVLKQPIPWIALLSMHWAARLFPFCTFVQTGPSQLLSKLRCWIQNRLLDVNLNDVEYLIQNIKTAYLLEEPLKRDNGFISLYELEILGWYYLQEKFLAQAAAFQPILQLLLKEAQLQLIDRPDEHWKVALNEAIQFFIQAHDICLTWSKADYSHRLLYWSLQGELVLRLLHFPETPLLHLVQEMSPHYALNEIDVTAQLREQFLSRYRSPLIEPSFVHQKADLLRRYVWYHDSSKLGQPTIDRWILLHERATQHLEPETRIKHLLSRAQKELPLLPLDRKWIMNLIEEKQMSQSLSAPPQRSKDLYLQSNHT